VGYETCGATVRYELRRAAEDDKDWLYDLKVDAYREVVERQFGAWNDRLQRELFEEAWRPNASCVISLDGTDVGLLVVEDRDAEVWLVEIQVGHAARSRGLGSHIIRGLVERARTEGKPLLLQVLHANHRAKSLYERLGFSRVGVTGTHYVMRMA
jgi:ribosomal protein S18 acetylase RimI-like enzyme